MCICLYECSGVIIYIRSYNSKTRCVDDRFQGLMDIAVRKYDVEASISEILHVESAKNLFAIVVKLIDKIKNAVHFAVHRQV